MSADAAQAERPSRLQRWFEPGRRYRIHARLLWNACPGWAVLTLAATVVCAALSILGIIAIGQFIGALPAAVRDGADSVAATRLWQWLGWVALALVGAPLLGSITGWARAKVSSRYLVHVFGLIAELGMHPRGIAHLDTPGFSARLKTLVESTRDWTFVFGLEGTWDVLQMRLAGAGAFVVLVSWRWWIPLVIAAAYFLLSKAFVGWVNTAFEDLFTSASTDRRQATYVRGLLTGADAAKEVRLFGLTGWLVSRYGSAWRSAMLLVWRRRNRGLVPIALAGVGMAIAIGGALVLLAHDAQAGAVTLGSVVMYIQAMLGLESFGILGDQQTSLARNTTATEKLAGMRAGFALPAVATGQHAPAPAASGTGPAAVDLNAVTFTYPTRDRPTVAGLDLHVPAGQSIAVVGVNGAGKSTLIKLICGLYQPGAGTVRVDGADPYADEAARRRVAVIFQDFVHYQLPLRDNVGFGSISHRDDPEVLRRALADAGGTDLLAHLDHGWDTVLDAGFEHGSDLSGGQWQRVALARALAAVAGGAGVLVLDEPTAALDVRAESALFDRFLQVTKGITTILVSHRLSSVRHADRIVVIDGDSQTSESAAAAEEGTGVPGGIVEDGTHEQLMATGGRYAAMFTLQARRFAAAGDAVEADRSER